MAGTVFNKNRKVSTWRFSNAVDQPTIHTLWDARIPAKSFNLLVIAEDQPEPDDDDSEAYDSNGDDDGPSEYYVQLFYPMSFNELTIEFKDLIDWRGDMKKIPEMTPCDTLPENDPYFIEMHGLHGPDCWEEMLGNESDLADEFKVELSERSSIAETGQKRSAEQAELVSASTNDKKISRGSPTGGPSGESSEGSSGESSEGSSSTSLSTFVNHPVTDVVLVKPAAVAPKHRKLTENEAAVLKSLSIFPRGANVIVLEAAMTITKKCINKALYDLHKLSLVELMGGWAGKANSGKGKPMWTVSRA
jgi:hypothetical protein